MSLENYKSIKNKMLTKELFMQNAGKINGTNFVKIVYDKKNSELHFINNEDYQFHADYISEVLLSTPSSVTRSDIDNFNIANYKSLDRRFFIGIVSFVANEKASFFTLETVEIDTMTIEMISLFHSKLRQFIELKYKLLFKPSSHDQEILINTMSLRDLPRILNRDLVSSKKYTSLNSGQTKGRLRCFATKEEFKENRKTLEWFDIILMPRVPDSIPRLSGVINSHHTTPLSHTNVLAHSWAIPNAIQIGAYEKYNHLNNSWVSYLVDENNKSIILEKIEKPENSELKPAWKKHFIKLEEPDHNYTPIKTLNDLRLTDRYIYGTKAANLGELYHVRSSGSAKMLGFYRIPRGPRPNYLPYLERYFSVSGESSIENSINEFISKKVHVPRGIALPFSIQKKFLESSPVIQQLIGKLKMALELKSEQVDSICVKLQKAIRKTRMPDHLRERIDTEIARHLAGCESLVVRSSSNAEDLAGFSAAGIYDSVNQVSNAENVIKSIKKVWSSLISPRSIRLRDEVGISLDDVYMGVIIQEEVKSEYGGVMVTDNPLARTNDLHNVYINVGSDSNSVVDNNALPRQYLYNTLEGQGKTLSLGDYREELSKNNLSHLEELSMAGRFLQSHYSPDYTFKSPLDIEWAISDDKLYLLQIRPYGDEK